MDSLIILSHWGKYRIGVTWHERLGASTMQESSDSKLVYAILRKQYYTSSSWLRRQRGPSRRYTTVSTANSAPPGVSWGTGRIISELVEPLVPGAARWAMPCMARTSTKCALTWSWRALSAGVSTSSWATCSKREVCPLDSRWDSEIRPALCSTSSFRTHSYQQIPSRRSIETYYNNIVRSTRPNVSRGMQL